MLLNDYETVFVSIVTDTNVLLHSKHLHPTLTTALVRQLISKIVRSAPVVIGHVEDLLCKTKHLLGLLF